MEGTWHHHKARLSKFVKLDQKYLCVSSYPVSCRDRLVFCRARYKLEKMAVGGVGLSLPNPSLFAL